MKYFIVNTKNKLSYQDVLNYSKCINNYHNDNVKLIICPSYPYLTSFLCDNYEIGSQDISLINKTTTSDVSIDILKSIGIKHVICGHSERRALGDNEEIVSLKVEKARNNDLKVILCVGETFDQRKYHETKQVIEKEIADVYNNISDLNDIIIAYEPIWAIGSNLIPTNEEIREVVILIKKIISEYYGKNVKVLYGGSVNLNNIEALNQIKELDGYLVATGALDVNNLLKMIAIIS